mmetsp:Transcript_27739/g.50547  ORF Transcript_27739/g.50547 Transcript_27739/m.50547 type:complete len:258 (+) Transcript_27739:1352-2125(+)
MLVSQLLLRLGHGDLLTWLAWLILLHCSNLLLVLLRVGFAFLVAIICYISRRGAFVGLVLEYQNVIVLHPELVEGFLPTGTDEYHETVASYPKGLQRISFLLNRILLYEMLEGNVRIHIDHSGLIYPIYSVRVNHIDAWFLPPQFVAMLIHIELLQIIHQNVRVFHHGTSIVANGQSIFQLLSQSRRGTQIFLRRKARHRLVHACHLTLLDERRREDRRLGLEERSLLHEFRGPSVQTVVGGDALEFVHLVRGDSFH